VKKPIIILINGISLAGKDTFCMFCSQYCNVTVMSLVDDVKRIARDELGWNGVKDEKGRKLLSDLRQTWNTYNNGASDSVISSILNYTGFYEGDDNPDIIFVMIRRFDEMMYFKDHPLLKSYIVQTMWVKRSGNRPGNTEQAFLDMIPKEYRFDYTIHNMGDLDRLMYLAKLFVHSIVEDKHTEPDVSATHLAYAFDKERGYLATVAGE